MRRLIGPALLGLACGCYLFSDKPKARKQTDAGAAQASGAGADSGQDGPSQDSQDGPNQDGPNPSEAVADCPEFLTGVESKARTIVSGCGPVRVRGQYRVEDGSLSVAAGVELRFEPGAVLEVGRDRPGVLTIAGTPEQPVRMIADSVSDSGAWQGVRLHAQADGSSLKHVEIAGAGTPEQGALWIAAAQVELEDLRIRGAAELALELVGGRGPQLLGAEISGSGGESGVVVRATPEATAGLYELKLEPGDVVAIAPGTVTSTLEWPPNPYRVEGPIRVEGEPGIPAQLSLTPGTELAFMPEGRIVVGALGPGSLSASANPPLPAPPPSAPSPPGTPSAMRDGAIRLRAAEGELPGSWGGLLIQDQGRLALRHVELAQGGARDEGVIVAEGRAALTVEGCVFRDNLVGVELRGIELEVERLDENEFVGTPVALRTTPTLLGALGPANRYDADARIHVERGKIETDTTWARQSAPIVVHGDLFVDKGATFTIAPGSRIGFDPGVILGVGYYEQATLVARGTADAPIVLEAAPSTLPDTNAAPAGAPWGGVVLGAHASKSRFEHLSIVWTANAAGIELRDTADATLVNVECERCAGATVTWDCESTIGNIGVRGGAQTPTAMAPPQNCK